MLVWAGFTVYYGGKCVSTTQELLRYNKTIVNMQKKSDIMTTINTTQIRTSVKSSAAEKVIEDYKNIIKCEVQAKLTVQRYQQAKTILPPPPLRLHNNIHGVLMNTPYFLPPPHRQIRHIHTLLPALNNMS